MQGIVNSCWLERTSTNAKVEKRKYRGTDRVECRLTGGLLEVCEETLYALTFGQCLLSRNCSEAPNAWPYTV